MSREPARSPGRLNIFRLFFLMGPRQIVAVLCFLMALSIAYPRLFTIDRVCATRENVEQAVVVDLGDRTFAIPKGFVWGAYPRDRKRITDIHLRTLYPFFEPYSSQNKAEFDNPGSGRFIQIVMAEHNSPGSRTGSHSMAREVVFQRVVSGLTITGYEEAIAGLTLLKYVDTKTPQRYQDEIYVSTKNPGEYWVKCTRDSVAKNPSCQTYVEYSNKVYLHYYFSKKNLGDWERINKSIVELVRSFDLKRH